MAAVTYNDALTNDSDKVRFQIGDTLADDGPLPGDANFTDAELDALLTREGTWQRTVAACYEVLASKYANHTTFSAHGGTFTRSDASSVYKKLAEDWRADWGYPGDTDTVEADAGVDSSGNEVVPLFKRDAYGVTAVDWSS